METREVPVIQQYVATETRVLEGAEHATTIGHKVEEAVTTKTTTHTSVHNETIPGKQTSHHHAIPGSATTQHEFMPQTTSTTDHNPTLMEKIKGYHYPGSEL